MSFVMCGNLRYPGDVTGPYYGRPGGQDGRRWSVCLVLPPADLGQRVERGDGLGVLAAEMLGPGLRGRLEQASGLVDLALPGQDDT